METQNDLDDILKDLDLQDWQKEILMVHKFDTSTLLEDVYELKKEQREMIEKVLYPSDSNPFYIVEKYASILKRVLRRGEYLESDKEALNYVRECYIKGKNFIK